jgi:SAM-dependent methyltransferase
MNCPLCNTEANILTAGENRQYQLCNLCGLIFVPPEFHVPAESEIARYREHENSLDSKGYVEMFMKKISLLKKYCPQVKTALDFGCGYEPVLKALLEKEGIKTEIYDLIFFPDLPKNKTFDLVISTETFEHFKNPIKDIQRAASCVSPSGFLAVMTRFYPMKKEIPCEESFLEWYYKRDLTHIVFYTSKTFEWLAKKIRFKIIYDNQFDFVLLQNLI